MRDEHAPARPARVLRVLQPAERGRFLARHAAGRVQRGRLDLGRWALCGFVEEGDDLRGLVGRSIEWVEGMVRGACGESV